MNLRMIQLKIVINIVISQPEYFQIESVVMRCCKLGLKRLYSEFSSYYLDILILILHGYPTDSDIIKLVFNTIYVQIFKGCNFRGLPNYKNANLGFQQFYFRGSLVITPCTSSVLK